MQTRTGIVTAALALAAIATSTHAQTIHRDIAYANVGGRDLLLDLYLPDDATSPTPVVLFIHGGGWAGGSHSGVPGYVREILDDDIAIASVGYRLTTEDGEWGSASVTFPAQIHDVKAAVRYLRANASSYNLDGLRVGAWGPSAGGHLAAMLATSVDAPWLEGNVGAHTAVSSAITAAVDYYGPSDLMNMDLDVTDPPGSIIEHDAWTSPESRLVGWDEPDQGIGDIRANINNPSEPYPSLVRLVADASPLRLATPADAPLFIAHGLQDTSVPSAQSTRLANRLAQLGVPHEIMLNPDAGHQYPGDDINEHAKAFLIKHLTCPGDLTRAGAPGSPPDGRVNLADLLFYVNRWDAEAPITDVTTTGMNDGDPAYGSPDGNVDLSDLLFYVNVWTVGLSECP